MNGHHRATASELAALTGLRGIAALWVVLYHVWVDAGPRAMTLGGIDFTPAFSCGWAGVDVFFTLSAFLLSLPFASWQLGAMARPALGTFWLRRVLRIFPAYYAQLAVLVALAAIGIGTLPSLATLAGNLVLWFNFGSISAAPINPVAYTLPIEFTFYLVLPLFASLLRPRAWILLLVFAIVETQAYRHLMYAAVAHADVPQRVLALEQLPGRLDQFVAGMLAAYAYTRAAIAGTLPRARVADALFALGAALVAAMVVAIHLRSVTYWDGDPLLFVWHGVVGAAVALMLFAAAAGSPLAHALFAGRVLRRAGVISFGLYLWHFPLIGWLDSAHAFDRIDGYRLPWSLPPIVGLAWLLAEASYRLVERPALRLGRARGRDPGVRTELVVAEPAPRE
ncbi:MAG TPA: acyltransferase [Dokdonella sp.]|nr:acyltransferase [Dokdonella sp.]